MMYTNIKYINITQSYSKTRKKMCVKPALSVNLTDTVGKGLIRKEKPEFQALQYPYLHGNRNIDRFPGDFELMIIDIFCFS